MIPSYFYQSIVFSQHNNKPSGPFLITRLMDIRNIAIIAHVDHGKTTLTDQMLKQTGMTEEGVSMDSNSIEQERGITIYAKNTSVVYKDPSDGIESKINILDTPGHADFSSEVERVLRSIDSVLLVVDAQEGPMPQTRFVLKKSLELGHHPIVVINKIDKPAANPKECHDAVFELFMELGATEEQLDFTTVYAIARKGVAMHEPTDESSDLTPLFQTILNHVPLAPGQADAPLKAQVFNLAYDNYLGRLAICRIYDGTLFDGRELLIKDKTAVRKGKVVKLFSFLGMQRTEITKATAGDIVMVAGLLDVSIGETLCDNELTEPMPPITIDEPTITLQFLINNSPFAGREGKYVTTRQIRERLEKEIEMNVGLKVDFDGGVNDGFTVYGRGEMHIAVLLENMRREGYEIQVSQPQAIIKDIDGVKSEPYEEVTIDAPSEFQGSIIEKLSKRKFSLMSMTEKGDRLRIILEGPTRGLFGYRGEFVIDTKGQGIFASRVIGFRDYAGEIIKRATGSMASMATGKALGFSLANLQTRGQLYIDAGTEVYEGMVVGNTSKGEDMSVNPTKGKQLTNMRASGSDDAVTLTPPSKIDIERGLELVQLDEYLEVTPISVRLRKQVLKDSERARVKRQSK